MKTLTSLLLGGLLALSVVACDDAAKTSSNAPESAKTTNTANNDNTSKTDKPTAQTNQNDATSDTRRKQLNSDIRAREQRNDADGNKSNKADSDIKSEVRSKLEANLPASALAVDSKEGSVTVTGTVVDDKQLQKIEPLAKQIGGVKTVTVKAAVATAAKPAPPKAGTNVPIKDQTGKK